MARPNEIAADARALYGPPAVRPAAGAMGDGALWVDPGDRQSLWQVQSGNWVRIALPDVDDDSSPPAGVPVLRGPYVVDYTDIPTDGATTTLWTPAVGDILLLLVSRLESDYTELDHGTVDIGTASVPQSIAGNEQFAELGNYALHPVFFSGLEAVQIRLHNPGGPDPTMGHADIFALVARAVAP